MSTTLLSAFYDIDFLCKVGTSVVPQPRRGLPAAQDGAMGPLGPGGVDEGRTPEPRRPPGTGRRCGRVWG